MRIDQIMTRDVSTCFANETLSRAAQLMWDNDCGCVPVIDGERRVIGMITDRDVCMAAYTQGRPIAEISVASAMSKQVFSCSMFDTPRDAERVMQEHQVRRVPVLDAQDRLVGLLSLYDLATEALRESGRKVRGVHAEEVDVTLAAINRRPVSVPIRSNGC